MRRLLLGGGILILVGLLASTQVMNSSNCCRPIPPLFARLSNFSRGDDPQPLPPPADVVEDVREFGQRALPNPLPGLCPLYVSASLSLSLPLEHFLIEHDPLCPDLGVARRESSGIGGGGC